MIRRNRRPDWRRIKTRRSYTIDEAASALRVHRNAIRYWITKCRLPVFSDRRPHLIHGADLVVFLKERRAANRQRCAPGQLFCLKCRRPQAPAGGLVDYQPVTPSRGALVGICPACATLMRRFVSWTRLATVAGAFDLQIAHREGSLGDTTMPRPNCQFHGED